MARAIELDPRLPEAYAGLAYACFQLFGFNTPSDREEMKHEALVNAAPKDFDRGFATQVDRRSVRLDHVVPRVRVGRVGPRGRRGFLAVRRVTEVDFDDVGIKLQVAFDQSFILTDDGENSTGAVSNERGALLLQFQHGQGMITLVNDLALLDNEHIGEHEHAPLRTEACKAVTLSIIACASGSLELVKAPEHRIGRPTRRASCPAT